MDLTPVYLQRRRTPNYDKTPTVQVGARNECAVGWEEVARWVRRGSPRVTVVEVYPGVFGKDLDQLITALGCKHVFDAARALKPETELEQLLAPFLTDDPVFGKMNDLGLEDFFDAEKLGELREQVKSAEGSVVVHGTGASLVTDGDALVYADMPRWEIQLRQRKNEIANVGASNFQDRPLIKYKRAYFIDWRVADKLKQKLLPKLDYVLDTTSQVPKLISGEVFRRALAVIARQPFRVVPFFDPAPWGGKWMQTVCDVGKGEKNQGWCFDCVPEENSLFLGFGDVRVEIPSIDLVLLEPDALLGQDIVRRFGAEFPIRFDFLDTMEGGNLSLQVHPLTAYIRDEFGMTYTQDESYYLLDAAPDAKVYLGLKEGVRPGEMMAALHRAQEQGEPFDDRSFVNCFPAKRHDHFLIPAGTVHGSGAGSMVLEVSATPYIFTFKLWDWGRLGLDGRPRPIHLDHGGNNIQWNRDTGFAKAELINRIEPVAQGHGWREERTGLHQLEFIETRRHWFTGTVPHDSNGTVSVLNLVEGEEVVVESPEGKFAPFVVHYAETFIIPACVGRYTIRPTGRSEGHECATLKAYVTPQQAK